MCFSAVGSFTLAGALTGIGMASLRRNTSKRRVMFAAIPLVFAAQQASEGVVWLTIDSSSHTTFQQVAVNLFLGFALVLWPVWLSWSLQLIEHDVVRRRMLSVLLGVGAAAAIGAIVLMTRSKPYAEISGHSLRYHRTGGVSGVLEALVLFAYVLPTIAPFFVSTVRLARTIGVMLVISLITAALVERDALTSVWCFFAAILSGVVWLSVDREERSHAAFQTLGENATI